jgi:hypothetical protein
LLSSRVAFGDGTGLLDLPGPGEETEATETREWLMAQRRRIEPGRLPAAVIAAARTAEPGLTIEEAFELRHRPMTYWRVVVEYSLKGRDAKGNPVAVRTADDGSRAILTRNAPLDAVLASDMAEARRFAAKHGYSITSAQAVSRSEKLLWRTKPHVSYYLKGTRPDRPGAERYVWLCGEGRFRVRDLDDLMIRSMGLD